LLVLAQGRIWRKAGGGTMGMISLEPQPTIGNSGRNQGPLGEEDLNNFHP
jgi:hypothetical protein